MKTYVITAEIFKSGKWLTQRIEIKGYLNSLRIAKALSQTGNGVVLMRDKATNRAKLI